MSNENIYFDASEHTIYINGANNARNYFYPSYSNIPSTPENNDTNKVWKTDNQGIPGWRDDANDGANITVLVTGNGNAIDGISMNNGTISATKNTNFLTEHQSVENKNAQLSFGNTSTIATIGGINIKVTMPSESASVNSSNISNNLTDDTKAPTVKAMVTYINNLVSTGNGGSY